MIDMHDPKVEKILKILGTPGDEKIAVTLWNDYCDKTNEGEFICPMDEFNEDLNWCEPLTLCRMMRDGAFDPDDAYYWTDGNTIESCNHPLSEYSPFDALALTKWMIKNHDALDYAPIEDVLDKE